LPFFVITITELKYAALTLTLMNIEKDFNIGRSCQNVFINNYHMWIYSPITIKEKKVIVVSTLLWCFSVFLSIGY